MALTPEEIESAEFRPARRGGYEPADVDALLEQIVAQQREQLARIAEAELANEDLRSAGEEIAVVMREVHSSLGDKRRAAEAEIGELKRRAEGEAANVIMAASDEAAVQIERATADAERIRAAAEAEVEALQADADDIIAEARRTAGAERESLLAEDVALRDEATEVLAEARTRSQLVVGEAEAEAAAIIRKAEQRSEEILRTTEAKALEANDTAIKASKADLRSILDARSTALDAVQKAREELAAIEGLLELSDAAELLDTQDDASGQNLVDIRTRMMTEEPVVTAASAADTTGEPPLLNLKDLSHSDDDVASF